MKDVLLKHFQKYPQMEVQDAVKLIYQSVFGSAHLVRDRESCIVRTRSELNQFADAPVRDAFEKIGGGYVRFYLNSAEARSLPPEFIADMFIETSHHNHGSVEEFEKALSSIEQLIEEEKAPFTKAAYETYINDYRRDNYQMVSHTAGYNEKYHPAYRVMLEEFARLYGIIKGIADVLAAKPRCVVAIDGRSASGKSTLASLLQRTFDATIVHMDDFFLPLQLRTPERFAQPGGNVHYERFQEEVTKGLVSGGEFAYQVFDCGTMQLGEWQKVENKAIVIVEGAYSLHPKIDAPYDLRVFSNIDPEKQKSRILLRNGEEMLKNFVGRWIPLENEYIDKCGIVEKCDIVVD